MVGKQPTASATKDFAYHPVFDKLFVKSEVFVTTNVTEYFFAGTDQEFWDIKSHFPNLAPLYDSFWIETKAPTHIRSAVHGMQPWTLSDSDLYRRPKRWGAWFLNIAPGTPIGDAYTQVTSKPIPDVENWSYAITLFKQDEDDGVPEPMWSFAMKVNKATGEAVRASENYPIDPYFFRSDAIGPTDEQIREIESRPDGKRKIIGVQDGLTGKVAQCSFRDTYEMEAITLLKPLLLAISFAHCRNVVRVPNHASPKQNKKRVARNLPPFHKFHTLEIGPMRKIIDYAAASYRGKKSTQIEMALHTVRGHFKTYTPEKPLMGHAVGTWFWGDTARGSHKRGTVTKQYEVKP